MRTSLKLSINWLSWIFAIFAVIVSHENAEADTFAWDPSPDQATGKVIGYKFYYSTQAFTALPADVLTNPAFTVLTLGTNQPGVTISSLVPGLTYFMTVTASEITGQESLPSNILAYTPGSIGISVALTSPANSAAVLSSDNIPVTAAVSGSTGISKVDFFDGATLLATKTASPYTFTTTFPAGTHVLTAKATDITGLFATSVPVTVTS